MNLIIEGDVRIPAVHQKRTFLVCNCKRPIPEQLILNIKYEYRMESYKEKRSIVFSYVAKTSACAARLSLAQCSFGDAACF